MFEVDLPSGFDRLYDLFVRFFSLKITLSRQAALLYVSDDPN